MDWSTENIMEFLEWYEKEPVIWNAMHSQHKNRNDVHDAWKRIEEKMGRKYTVTELKRKRESLMASFRTSYNKVKQTLESGADEVYKPKWFAYAKMASFLKDKDQSRITINLEVIQSEEESEFDEMSKESCVLVKEEPTVVQTRAEEVSSFSKFSVKPPLQKKKNVPEAAEPKTQKTSEAQTSSIQKNIKRKDVCDLYGQLIAEKLRRMDERNRDIAMNRIDNLLFELKMNQNMPFEYHQCNNPHNQELTLVTSPHYSSPSSSTPSSPTNHT